jgi:hypothetical protein
MAWKHPGHGRRPKVFCFFSSEKKAFLAFLPHASFTAPAITQVLMRTPSGIGIQYSPELHPTIGPVIEMFSESVPGLAHVRQCAALGGLPQAEWRDLATPRGLAQQVVPAG